MSTWFNLGAFILALTLAMVAVAGTGHRQRRDLAMIPEAGFQRIVSLGIVSDAALAALCEPQRVIAVSAWSTGPVARQWSGKPRLSGLDDLEAIIALHPDLVLVSTSDADSGTGSEADRLARLRSAGVRVEALGPMRGLVTYAGDLAHIGDLLGRGDEARLIGRRLSERLARIADSSAVHPLTVHPLTVRPPAVRPRAVYVAAFSGTLFGGTKGTSYHDVLVAAGCDDAAATIYAGWPQYSIEQVITLAPELIVTKRGMGDVLRALPGMQALHQTRIIEITGELLEDPGPRLLEAAEELHAALEPAELHPALQEKESSKLPANPSTATSR